MKPAAWILLLFVLSGGISALLGNELARRIGKRKLRVFSLRPKHSSTLLSVVINMALSAGIFGLFLAFSGPTRQALLAPETPLQDTPSASWQIAHVSRRLRARLERPMISGRPSAQPGAATAPAVSARVVLQPVRSALPLLRAVVSPSVRPSVPGSKASRLTPRQTPAPAVSIQPPLAVSPAVATPSPLPTVVAVAQVEPEPAPQVQVEQVAPHHTLLALANETLIRFETPAAVDETGARALLARMLEWTETYALRLGAVSTEGSALRVSEQNLNHLQRQLESSGALLVEVQTLQAARAQTPLAVQFRWQPVPDAAVQPPEDLLERERLRPEVIQQALASEILPAIQAALARRERPPLPLSPLPEPVLALVSPARLGLSLQSAAVGQTLLNQSDLHILLWLKP